MTTFDEREKGFENKYKRDQELDFKVTARRNKLLGIWAAGQLGIEGDAAEAYAKEVIAADFEEPGEEDVVRKVMGDFEKNGVGVDEKTVRLEMEKLRSTARQQIESEA